jgi:hypothetical protein
MHAYAWYVWRKMPRSGPSVKVRIGKAELMAFPAAANLQTPRAQHRLVAFETGRSSNDVSRTW